jgi:hypothetical protein
MKEPIHPKKSNESTPAEEADMHLLPVDELRRQFDAGEIDQTTYIAMRGTRPEPAERLCDIPGCHRTADRMDRGKALCSVCCQKAKNQRTRGLN